MNQFFDQPIPPRVGVEVEKWDLMGPNPQPGVVPLSVADMEFRSPPAIVQALEDMARSGLWGYAGWSDRYYNAIRSWVSRRYGWEIQRDWIIRTTGVVHGINAAVRAFTQPGDGIVIQTPVYPPFYRAVRENGRTLLENPLKLVDGHYEMDFDRFAQVAEEGKVLLFSSPHNPVGRVWSREELEKVGEFCVKHDLILFVDEIHGDITAQGVDFISSLSLSKKVRKRLVVATSLTKTFNIPGVILSYLVIPNEEIREKVARSIDRIGMHNPTIFSMAATEAAYTQCDDWYEAVLVYIDENEKYTRSFFSENMPEFHIYPREGTYLLWIDYRALGCTEEELDKWFIEEARVSVYMGTVFQEEGRGFIRLNIASPRKLLEEAYRRMAEAYGNLKK